MISIEMFRCSIGLFNSKTNIFAKRYKYKNSKFNFLIAKYLSIFLLFLGNFINHTFEKICQSNNNKLNHIGNGNISGKGTYKFLSWNKGNSNFETKRDDILITLQRQNPDIFAIHEANYSILKDRKIKGYNIEYNNLCDRNDICRTITLIKNGISFKRRYDLEDKFISSIWLQIYIKKKV